MNLRLINVTLVFLLISTSLTSAGKWARTKAEINLERTTAKHKPGKKTTQHKITPTKDAKKSEVIKPAPNNPEESNDTEIPRETVKNTTDKVKKKNLNTDLEATPEKNTAEKEITNDSKEKEVKKLSLDEIKRESKLTLLREREALCSIYHAAGIFELFLGDRQLANTNIYINNTSVLKNASYKQHGRKRAIITKKIESLLVTTEIHFIDNEWLGISIRAKNQGNKPTQINDIRFLDCSLNTLFGDNTEKLNIFADSFLSTEKSPGKITIKDTVINANNLAVIYNNPKEPVWFMSWQLPHRKPYIITVDNKNNRLNASINLNQTPISIASKESINFGQFIINGSLPFFESLNKFAEQNKSEKPNDIKHGFIFTEKNNPSINAERSLKRLKSLAEWKDGAPYIAYYILAEGWNLETGNWAFNSTFNNLKPTWSKAVKKFKAIPGISLSPFRTVKKTTPDTEAKLPAAAENLPFTIYDPSTGRFTKKICSQLYNLKKAGIECLILRGLSADYNYGEKTPTLADKTATIESSLSYNYSAIRNITGRKTVLISNERQAFVTAGIIDILLASTDAPRSWSDLRDNIVKQNAGRFWLHNNIFNLTQAPLYIPTDNSDSNTDLSHKEFLTLCRYLIITGGSILLTGDAENMSESTNHIILKTLKYSGGNSGTPIDILTNNLPEKWVRKERNLTYIAFFNWQDKKKEISITYKQVNKLAKKTELKDLLTEQSVKLDTGRLNITLEPHSSFIAIVK